jgi:transposase-like protein
MGCPHCESADTRERRERTALGYRRFRCRGCNREFNERTGTRFNHLQYPTDIVCLVVLWRVRYKLSLRDLPEMFLERGFVFTHEAVREWEAQLTDTTPIQERSKPRSETLCVIAPTVT